MKSFWEYCAELSNAVGYKSVIKNICSVDWYWSNQKPVDDSIIFCNVADRAKEVVNGLSQNEVIDRIKDLKSELRHKFDDSKLIRLYYLIEQLKGSHDS